MPAHHHNHSHHHVHKADKWTVLNAFGEAISQTFSSVAIGETIDFLIQGTPVALNLSSWGLGGFAIGAAITAFGCTYSHFKWNLNNQPCDHDHDQEIEAKDEPLVEDEDHSETEHNEKEEPSDDDIPDELISNSATPTNAVVPNLPAANEHHHHPKKSLSTLDYFALFGDGAGHMLENAGPIIMAATQTFGNDMSTPARVLTFTFAIVIGSVCAKANVTTCANNMTDHEEHIAGQTNFWTKAATWGELVTYMVTNPVWISDLYDTCSGATKTMFDKSISKAGLGIGTGVTLCTATASFMVHRVVLTNNQHSAAPLTKEEAKVHLTFKYKLLLGLDYVSHVSDIAPKVTLGINWMTSNANLSRPAEAGIKVSTALICCLFAKANSRTCGNGLRRKIYHDQVNRIIQAEPQATPQVDYVPLDIEDEKKVPVEPIKIERAVTETPPKRSSKLVKNGIFNHSSLPDTFRLPLLPTDGYDDSADIAKTKRYALPGQKKIINIELAESLPLAMRK